MFFPSHAPLTSCAVCVLTGLPGDPYGGPCGGTTCAGIPVGHGAQSPRSSCVLDLCTGIAWLLRRLMASRASALAQARSPGHRDSLVPLVSVVVEATERHRAVPTVVIPGLAFLRTLARFCPSGSVMLCTCCSPSPSRCPFAPNSTALPPPCGVHPCVHAPYGFVSIATPTRQHRTWG
jgi:hypothetical protein